MKSLGLIKEPDDGTACKWYGDHTGEACVALDDGEDGVKLWGGALGSLLEVGGEQSLRQVNATGWGLAVWVWARDQAELEQLLVVIVLRGKVVPVTRHGVGQDADVTVRCGEGVARHHGTKEDDKGTRKHPLEMDAYLTLRLHRIRCHSIRCGYQFHLRGHLQ